MSTRMWRGWLRTACRGRCTHVREQAWHTCSMAWKDAGELLAEVHRGNKRVQRAGNVQSLGRAGQAPAQATTCMQMLRCRLRVMHRGRCAQVRQDGGMGLKVRSLQAGKLAVWSRTWAGPGLPLRCLLPPTAAATTCPTRPLPPSTPLLLAADLKPALSRALNQILQPVRDHFENNAEAKELLKKVKTFKVTK